MRKKGDFREGVIFRLTGQSGYFIRNPLADRGIGEKNGLPEEGGFSVTYNNMLFGDAKSVNSKVAKRG